MASVMARKLTRLREKPRRSITQKVGTAESGSATAAMKVARQFRRKARTTSVARSAPSRSVWSAAS